jgi:pimeloyl-ACP methyl ester carboxylesterase
MTEELILSHHVDAKPQREWKSIAVELLGTQTRFVQGERWRHRVIEGGTTGEPLILIHGIGGHAEAFARNVNNLAAHGFHVFAIDLLHHGYTDKHPYSDESRVDQQTEALVDLMRALELEWAHIEGQSLGAYIAFELGMRYPQMCGKLILNTGFGLVRLKKTDFDNTADGAHLKELKELSIKSVMEPTFDVVRRRMEWLMATPDRATDELVELRLRLYSDPAVHESMKNIYFIGKEWSTPLKWEEEDVHKFQHETLVLWTDHNPQQGVDYARYVADLLPDAKLYIMGDTGHWPQWEKPEEHDQVLIEFIKPT